MLYTHPREVWQSPSQPIWSSNAFEYSDVDLFVIHYPGVDEVPSGDIGEFQYHIPNWLRNTQNYYLTHRGYSLGYNVAVDWLGGTWEIRGDDFECAANYGINHRAFAVLMIVDRDEPATEYAVNAVRNLYSQVRPQVLGDLTIIRHGDAVEYNPDATITPCPGIGVSQQVSAGQFYPLPPPPPPPPPTTGRNVMLPMIGKYPDHGVWVYSLDGGRTHHAISGGRAHALVAGGAIYAKGKTVVTSWTPVQDFSSLTEVQTYLGTRVS